MTNIADFFQLVITLFIYVSIKIIINQVRVNQAYVFIIYEFVLDLKIVHF